MRDMDMPSRLGIRPLWEEESPTQRLDRLVHSSVSPLAGGISPVSLALAWADWAWHLAVSPGRQMDLGALAMRHMQANWRVALGEPEGEPAGDADDDPRFRDPAWAMPPFNVLRSGFRQAESYWRVAAHVPGMTAHHVDMTRFFARQWLGMMAPANWLPTNPVVLRDVVESGGAHLLQGAIYWWRDLGGVPDPLPPDGEGRYEVGRDVAITPGQVVMRNRLIELIRYAPTTPKVHPEPLLIVPSWIMKYYILDLSPHNSMVRYLVDQGHVVYMMSWHNPTAEDRDTSMDDYLELGLYEALRAIARWHHDTEGHPRPVHTMGYCLGGTLLAIAAAAFGHHDGAGDTGPQGLPPLASLTLLAAQTDFSEPGELGLFIDESQVGFVEEITHSQGYLTGRQMAGSFQFLHSRDLFWTRRMREYLMGEREPRSDLMAWNADRTRMPARMHHEYLTALFLHNALATSSYRVDGHAISLNDIHQPVFLVGTERDHVSPWRSVYKLHHLCDAEITFVLTVGGHNAGIISEPGHPHRSYRIGTRAPHGKWVEPEAWLPTARRQEGSWWQAWHEWLAQRSGPPQRARPLPANHDKLGPAPGRYVFECYDD
jgi:polyhydroxyalkanoate synthase